MSASGGGVPPIKKFFVNKTPVTGGSYGTQEGLFDFFADMANMPPERLKAISEEKIRAPIEESFHLLLNNCPDIKEQVQNLIQCFQDRHPEVFNSYIKPEIEKAQAPAQLELDDDLPTLESPSPKKAAFFQEASGDEKKTGTKKQDDTAPENESPRKAR